MTRINGLTGDLSHRNGAGDVRRPRPSAADLKKPQATSGTKPQPTKDAETPKRP
jgi:hypothetical protein